MSLLFGHYNAQQIWRLLRRGSKHLGHRLDAAGVSDRGIWCADCEEQLLGPPKPPKQEKSGQRR